MPHIPKLGTPPPIGTPLDAPAKVVLVLLDMDDGRAEVILGSPDGTTFVVLRGAAGNWADGSVVPVFSPGDTFENFSTISGSEAEILSHEALAAVPSPKPIRNKAASPNLGN